MQPLARSTPLGGLHWFGADPVGLRLAAQMGIVAQVNDDYGNAVLDFAQVVNSLNKLDVGHEGPPDTPRDLASNPPESPFVFATSRTLCPVSAWDATTGLTHHGIHSQARRSFRRAAPSRVASC